MRKNRTYNLREDALPLIYYMKAILKLSKHENASEESFWDSAFSYGVGKINQIYEQGKKIYFVDMGTPRIIVGGHVEDTVYNDLMQCAKKNKLKKYQAVESCLVFYAKNIFSQREIDFFQLDDWGIIIK